MGALKITPDQLDELERLGMRFGWRARLLATGEPLTDAEFRAMRAQHRLTGCERTWELEHVVGWPHFEPGDSRAEAFRELRETYERYPRVREQFAIADGARGWENAWVASSSSFAMRAGAE